MEVTQCEFCRRLYQSAGNRLCNDCLIKLDEDFIKIREYLYEHDRAGIEEVSEATGVSRKTIMFLLKEERLTVSSDRVDGGGILVCEACKKPISTGRICESCRKEVISALQDSVRDVGPPVRRPESAAEYPNKNKGVAKLQLKGKGRF